MAGKITFPIHDPDLRCREPLRCSKRADDFRDSYLLAMHSWLQDFAYRVDLSWWIFLGGGVIALGIALITISWQAIRAGNANPIDSLRSE